MRVGETGLKNVLGISGKKLKELNNEDLLELWFLYVLLCEDQSLYTGISSNLDKRLNDHKLGKGGSYTRSHQPVKIIYQEQFQTHSEALKREFEIKSWSRKKKLAGLKLKF